MENLQMPKAKLLYLVSELWKNRDITDTEKLYAKDLIISGNEKVLQLIEEQEINFDMRKFKNSLLDVILDNTSKTKTPQSKRFNKEENNQEPEEITSPLGIQLVGRKRLHQQKMELNDLSKGLKATESNIRSRGSLVDNGIQSLDNE